jgi:putative addiction module component (TIGR02574 family)
MIQVVGLGNRSDPMTTTLRDLGIDRMSVDDRLDLMNQIGDSLAAENDRGSLSEARRLELERRSADHVASPDDVVAWDEVKTDVLSRLER